VNNHIFGDLETFIAFSTIFMKIFIEILIKKISKNYVLGLKKQRRKSMNSH
jgi:hypothetical protein